MLSCGIPNQISLNFGYWHVLKLPKTSDKCLNRSLFMKKTRFGSLKARSKMFSKFHLYCSVLFPKGLKRNSTLGRCKIGKCVLLSQFEHYQTFVINLHLLRVRLRWKLQEKLHRVTKPLMVFGSILKTLHGISYVCLKNS